MGSIRNLTASMAFEHQVSFQINRQPRDLDPNPINRSRSSNVKAAVISTAPAHIGSIFRHANYAQALCLGRKYMDSAGAAAIHVARRIDLHSVRRAGPFTLRLGPK